MISYKIGAEPSELDVLGPPEELSAVTQEGDPIMQARNMYQSENGQISSGIYEVSKGKFTVVYPFYEHATVLEGEVTLTDRAGNSVTYKPGDSWFVHQGEVIVWEVKERLRKTFCVFGVDAFGAIPSGKINPTDSKITA